MIVKKKRIVVQLNSTELSAEELKKSLNDALLCMKFENSLEKESNDSQDIQRRLADTCELLGDIYFEIWKKSDSLREESVFSDLEDDCELETEFLYYYGKSIHIWEKLQNNYGNVLDGMELIRVYEKESKLTSGMYGSGFAKTEKIIPVYKRLFQNFVRTPELMDSLLNVYEQMIAAYWNE